MYRSVGTDNLKRHPLTFSIILTLIAGMVLCAVPVQGISAQTSFFMQSGQPLYSARTSDYRSGYAAQYSAVLRTLAGGAKPEFGSVGGEWKVLALARSGFYPTQSGYFSEYYAKIEKLVAANGSPKLHPQKSTENSRLIIALSSIGRDARSVAGFDLTAPLGDFNYVKKQGLNGVIFALIALDCNKNYGMSDIKSQCVDLLLSRECDGGGWALGLGAAEADITAMAITALAPYRKAAAAIERGVEKLSALDEKYQREISSSKRDVLLFADRFPFRYMTDDYSLTCYAAFPGCSAETQASFETITFLAGKINELGLTSVITIDGSDSKIANTVINETQPKHLNILTLDSMQSITSKDIENGFTYLSVMENNLENIKTALN